jgi:glycine cleavage system H protein
MSEPLIFRMGEFQAEFPIDRVYARNHMWATAIDRGFRFGFTAYAVRLLQDVYFLDWTVEPAEIVAQGQEIGSIESKKAESTLYSPLSGRLVRYNQQLMRDPSSINTDKYDSGWLFEMEGPGDLLVTPEEYHRLLDEVWEKTQRTIKGQMNE